MASSHSKITSLMRALYRDERLTSSAITTALAMAYHGDWYDEEIGNISPAINTLASNTRQSRSTVIRAIGLLIDCGIVTRSKRPGRTTVYTIPSVYLETPQTPDPCHDDTPPPRDPCQDETGVVHGDTPLPQDPCQDDTWVVHDDTPPPRDPCQDEMGVVHDDTPPCHHDTGGCHSDTRPKGRKEGRNPSFGEERAEQRSDMRGQEGLDPADVLAEHLVALQEAHSKTLRRVDGYLLSFDRLHTIAATLAFTGLDAKVLTGWLTHKTGELVQKGKPQAMWFTALTRAADVIDWRQTSYVSQEASKEPRVVALDDFEMPEPMN